ncbi:uncharacterized protein BDV17DRAFT_274168, partial [Aspergillus undulatus]|uniref:uncharacterized protein n=1 Tax=Aspergillus undulatus TaxID=1810928 RepID=UPI003CCC8FF1
MSFHGIDRLPIELLSMIVELSMEDDAIRLSCVSRKLRAVCVPYLFKTICITFSASGLERLRYISSSTFAQHVKVVRYKVPELIDPYVCSWEYFRSCVYSPAEFIRDQREQWWSFREKSFSYESIHNYFSELSKEQQKILAKCDDARALHACLPCFARLETIQLICEDGIDQPFRWLATSLFFDWNDSMLMHLETLVEVMRCLRQHGVSIRSFGVFGFNSYISTTDQGFLEKMADALGSVTDVMLVDSTGLLPCLASIQLPSILRLELGSCWLQISDLEDFCLKHNRKLQHIHFEDVWVSARKVYDWGVSLSTGNLAALVDNLVVLRKSGVLQQITVNRKDDGQYEHQEWLALESTV